MAPSDNPGGPPRPPGAWPPAANSHWDNLAERRLDEINQQMRELRGQVSEVWSELRKEIRAGDNRQALLTRLDERFNETIKRMDEQLRDTIKRMDDWRRQADADREKDRESDAKRLVSREEFDPIKKAVVALIGALCLTVLGAVLKGVLK